MKYLFYFNKDDLEDVWDFIEAKDEETIASSQKRLQEMNPVVVQKCLLFMNAVDSLNILRIDLFEEKSQSDCFMGEIF